MAVLTLKVLASLLQLHGPDATIQSDHEGIDALLADVRGQIANGNVASETPAPTEVYFRRGFVRGGGGGAFRRGGAYGGGFRRGGFLRY
jgi:hypothetical protein